MNSTAPATAPATGPETILTNSTRVRCDGASAIAGGAALGHPRVWLEIDAHGPHAGYADCGYCDRRFVLKGGAADRGYTAAFDDGSASRGAALYP